MFLRLALNSRHFCFSLLTAGISGLLQKSPLGLHSVYSENSRASSSSYVLWSETPDWGELRLTLVQSSPISTRLGGVGEDRNTACFGNMP